MEKVFRMDNNDKGLNRGGTLGQEGESNPRKPQENINQRDQQKPQGGQGREPNLEKKPQNPEKKQVQPTHQVD